MRRVLGLIAGVFGLALLGITISKAVTGTFSDDLSTSILYASFSILLLVFGGWLLFD